MILSDDVIEAAKQRKGGSAHHHEHNDCIRIAFEWLDAQKKTKGLNQKGYALKHMIEGWAGRYVSQDDVEVAAILHPEIKGKYPSFNISARLVEPSQKRLQGIGEAHKHNTYPRSSEAYLSREE